MFASSSNKHNVHYSIWCGNGGWYYKSLSMASSLSFALETADGIYDSS